MTVLVAVASRHGSTEEIARAIGASLKERGLDAEVVRVDEVDDVAGYDAVVLGSAVYAGRWLESARRFVDEHVSELATLPIWLFSSGPIGAPPKPESEEAVHVDKVMSLTHAREHRLFAGQLVRSRLSFAERAVTRAFHAPEGDFRDWDEIDAWAGEIAEALLAGRVAAQDRPHTQVPG
jgi:menaquinone-dependent protoporphyrinogen oxidase